MEGRQLGVKQRSRDDLDGRRTVVRLTPQAEAGIRQVLDHYLLA